MEKHSLLDHQKQAVKAINKAAKSHDRTQINMACGTGKTLIGLQYAFKSKATNILVLLPSLGLMKQTLEYWLSHSDWGMENFMCVCSDASVTSNAYDEAVITSDEFSCSVSTNVIDVKTFFRKRNARPHNIVFCTYQSADIVSKAMPRDFVFDLGIFDEAHKTAGNKDKHFGLGLDDGNIKIDFRLFMTATPKHYRIKKKDDFDNKELAYSMDDRDVYGDVCYKFNFAEAVKQNIICDFKIIISAIDSNEIDRLKLRTSKIDDNDIEAVQIAHRLALANGLKGNNINKIISFHPRVSDAKEFIHYENNKYFSALDGFNMSHVNGKMSSGDRHKIIDGFREAKKGILTNARCLTEGVDVPVVDCVAFLSPKKSSIDIVQAVGRAMRKHKGKKLGYVFIPLYLNSSKNEEVSAATEITGFDYTVNILNALTEYDPAFNKIVAVTMNNFGQTGDFDFNKIKNKISIEYTGRLNTKVLEKIIFTKFVKKIGSNWDYRFGQLQEYKKIKGDCLVPKRDPKNKELGTWVGKQRSAYNKGDLAKDKVKKLNDLGFVWDVAEARWLQKYKELQEYKKIKGDCLVPKRDPKNKELGTWVGTQRSAYNKGDLAKDKVKKLDDLGFVWDVAEARWLQKYKELQEYKKINGDCLVSAKDPKNKELGGWVGTQRRAYKNNPDFAKDKVKKLDDLGFVWDVAEARWLQKYKELQEYKKINGDCLVSAKDPKNKELGGWVGTQRRAYKNNPDFAKDKVKKLDDLGFVWETRK